MRHWLAAGLGALLVGVGWGGGAAGLEKGPFDAERVHLGRLSGELELEVTPAERVTLRLDGPDALVKAVKVEVDDGGTLRVIGPPWQTTTSTAIGVQVVITVGPGGGSRTVVIGGQHGEAVDPLRIAVEIPAGMPVRIEDFAGEAVVGDTRAPIEVELLSGDVRIGAVGDAKLAVNGAGDIEAGFVGGQLDARVTGSGSIAVADAAIDDLRVGISGAGDVRICGRAETAELDLDGVGSITVDEIGQRPRVRVNGVGGVEVGNC